MKNYPRQLTRRLTLLTLVMTVVCAASFTAHAALVIGGDMSGAPGDTISLTLELDANLVADIDELTLALQFDDAVLNGQSAGAGPLLAGGIFAANAATGAATNSYLATLTELGPGLFATWTFMIDPGAAAQSTNLQATLRTFVIDDELTAELISVPFAVAVVPVPPALILLGSAFGLLAARSRSRSGVQ